MNNTNFQRYRSGAFPGSGLVHSQVTSMSRQSFSEKRPVFPDKERDSFKQDALRNRQTFLTDSNAGYRSARPSPMRTSSNEVGIPTAAEGQVGPKCFRCQRTGHLAKFCRNIATLGDSLENRSVKSVEINGKQWTARVDTEAQVSVMAVESADALELELLPSRISSIIGVGGFCKPVGQVQVAMKVDDTSHDDVVITVLPEGALNHSDVLIGKDLLDRGLVTVYVDGTAFILDRAKLCEISKCLPTAGKVRLLASESVSIPPRSVSWIRAEIPDPQDQMLLMENDEFSVLIDGKQKEILFRFG